MTTEKQYYYATGRRKTSVARVRLYMDSGPIVVNGVPMEEAFGWPSWQQQIVEPFKVTGTASQFRVVAKITGGGVVSQAGALRHGISRALIEADPNLRSPLKKAGLLTRDAREKESKKYGLKRARKAKQYTKR
ncbi:MAG: 30S ribosomal protein S9 [SAR202 cluster bacterium]|nr:30S ribosomal protein S9 [SAR202 cluster bacterium]